MTFSRIHELCSTRFVLIGTLFVLASVLLIATFRSSTSTLPGIHTVASPGHFFGLDTSRGQFGAVTVFGVASVYHQVLELTRVLQAEGVRANAITN